MNDIDPKDAGRLVSVAEDEHFAGPGEASRCTVVVRLLKQQPVLEADLPPDTRVRPLASIGGARRRTGRVRTYVVYASTYTRYEANRIAARLRQWDERPVRISTVRALMHSVRLPVVKETFEYEDAL